MELASRLDVQCWEKVFILFQISYLFAYLSHVFQIKHILIIYKDNPSKYKMQFLNDVYIYKGEIVIQTYLLSKPNDWLCHPWQQEQQSSICDNCFFLRLITVRNFGPLFIQFRDIGGFLSMTVMSNFSLGLGLSFI